MYLLGPAVTRRVPLTGASVPTTDTKLAHWGGGGRKSPEHTKGRRRNGIFRGRPRNSHRRFRRRQAGGSHPASTRRTSVGSRPELARRCAPPRPRCEVAGCCGELGGRFADRVRSGNACTMICTRSCDPSRCGGGSTLKVGPLSATTWEGLRRGSCCHRAAAFSVPESCSRHRRLTRGVAPGRPDHRRPVVHGRRTAPPDRQS